MFKRTIIQRLGMDLIGREIGGNIPTVSQYISILGASAGSISNAMGELLSSGAISVRPRGRLGTILLGINYSRLYQAIIPTPILCAMPLPYTKRYEGLAMGLYKSMDKEQVPYHNLFMSGGKSRIEALVDGRCDVCVLSASAFQDAIKSYDIDIAVNLGEKSFLSGHALIYSPERAEDIKTISVDTQSYDQIVLVESFASGKGLDVVYLPYSQILDCIERGIVDSTIWNIDVFGHQGLSLYYSNLDCHQDYTSAVLVVRNRDTLTRTVLANIVSQEFVLDIQRRVVSNDIPPEY